MLHLYTSVFEFDVWQTDQKWQLILKQNTIIDNKKYIHIYTEM